MLLKHQSQSFEIPSGLYLFKGEASLSWLLIPMKKLFIAIWLLILPLYSVFACSCANVDLNNRYLIYDFIGVVEIEGLFDNEENKRF